jgi:molybdenum cofactor cytidylyltransferase
VADSGLPFHVVHPDPSRPGMGDSIAAGVRATPDAPAWLVLPADLPLVRGSTLRAIADSSEGAVTVPRFQGQRGHPVRFARECGPDLLLLKGSSGAAQVVLARAAINSVAFVEVDDAGVVTDVDTLDDLQRAQALFELRHGPGGA